MRAASTICAAGTPATARHALGRERRDRGPQRFESVGLGGDESAVVQALGEDHVEHGRQQLDVVPRQALQVQVGLARRLGHARVDHDQLQARVRAPRAAASPG